MNAMNLQIRFSIASLTVATIAIASKTSANTSEENWRAKQIRPSKIGDKYGTSRWTSLELFKWSQNLIEKDFF